MRISALVGRMLVCPSLFFEFGWAEADWWMFEALPHYSPTKAEAKVIDRDTPYLK